MMKKKKYIQTKFLRFILEDLEKNKHEDESQIELISNEETNETDEEIIDEIDNISNEDNEGNQEPLEDIIKEYLRLDKLYKKRI